MRIPLHNPEIAGGVRSEQHSTATAVLSDRHEQQLLPSPGGLNASDVNREQGSGRNAAARDVGLDVEDGERWRYRLGIGSKLDVEDTVLRWCEASVVEVDDVRAAVFVTYTYWAREYDEWVCITSGRLAPPGTKTYQEGGRLCVGHRVEAMDDTGEWIQACVEEVYPDGRALVNFVRHDNKPNIMVRPRGGRVRQYGPYRAMPRGKTSARQASLAPGQQHVRQIAELSSRYEHYGRALRSQGLRVVQVEGDGNCLFRSVSHQIYGDDSHHRLVRARCMDYMESEAHFFEPYVEGDMAAFLRYLGIKRRNAVWGDDPEVQALSEIYDRPAEIWAYDPQLGAKRLRTFHEAAGVAGGSGHRGSRRPPMRLSYYGGGHYDSVSPIDDDPYSAASPVEEEGAGVAGPATTGAFYRPASGVIAEAVPEPGQLEEVALERSRKRAAEASGGRWGLEEMKLRRDDEGSSGQTPVDKALAFSRNEFEAQFDDLDSALVASVDHMEQSNLISLEAASRDSELVVLQEEMLRSAQAQSEEEQMRNALEASCKTAAVAEDEAEMVRQALAESMASAAAASATAAVAVGVETGGSESEAGSAGGAQADDGATMSTVTTSLNVDRARETTLGGTMEDDEEEELKRAILLSTMGAEGGGAAVGGAGAALGQESALSDELQEDPELRFAINASLTFE